MESKAFENEFLKNLGLLSKDQQSKVLAFVKSLLSRDQKTNQQELLKFAGSIDPNSILEMSTAIEAGCENVDKNEW